MFKLTSSLSCGVNNLFFFTPPFLSQFCGRVTLSFNRLLLKTLYLLLYSQVIKIPKIEIALPRKYSYMSLTRCKHDKLIESAIACSASYQRVRGSTLTTREIINSLEKQYPFPPENNRRFSK
jgi:hypothetical protein